VTPDEPLRLVIADDHPVYRDGLSQLLSATPGIEVVAVAGSGEEAVALALNGDVEPDVVVMDLRMSGIDGIEATRRITTASPHIAVLVLSMFDDDDLIFSAIRAGARGYLLKDADDREISRAVLGVGRGEAIFGPTIAHRLLAVLSRAGPPVGVPFPQLTTREREVLELLARGVRNTEIAERLSLGHRTVRNYVSNIFTKLQVADRAQAIATARDVGIGGFHAPPID
jgi:DNA-binding NarL/FixJ family response regulator